MPVESPRFIQPKTPAEVVNQVAGNSRYIESLTGQPLIPPSIGDATIFGEMSQDEVVAQFGSKRVGILVEVMRADIMGRDLDFGKRMEIQRWLGVLNGVDRYINLYQTEEENRTLRPMQMEVFEALGKFLQNGGKEGYFKLPTAFGKTVIFTEFAKAAGLKTLIVVPTIEILDQTEDTFAKLAPDLELGKVYADAKDFQGQITVTTYESLVRLVNPSEEKLTDFDFLPEEYDLVILDEAHHALGIRASEAVPQFINAIKLGFTATPVYSESRQLSKLLNSEIFGMSIKEAAEQGQLSPFKVWLALTNTDLSNVWVESSTEDYNQAQLARAVNTAQRNQAAYEVYKQHFQGESAVINCVSVKHAQDVARLFREKGEKAEAVWGGMNKKRRDAIVKDFKDGEMPVLCNMQLLTEGFDAPNASVCINLRPTLSGVTAEQRGGRVLRLDPANPNKEATIVDFVDRERSERRQVTFAEVAETAGVPKKLEGQTGVVSYPGRGRYLVSPESQGELVPGGVRVITQVTEIMRIASESKAFRVQINVVPEGFSIFHYKDVASDYPITYAGIAGLLDRLNDKHPEYFIRRTGRPVLIKDEGLELLKAELEKRKTPEGFARIPFEQLLDETQVSWPTYSRYIRDLRTLYPEEFRFIKGFPQLATQRGIDLLNEALKTLHLPDNFSQVNITSILEESGIPRPTSQDMITALETANPDDFRRRGKSKRLFATTRGLSLLRDVLARRREIQDTYQPVDPIHLAQSIGEGITARMVKRRLLVVAPQNPEHFSKYGKSGGYMASERGLELLREALQSFAIPEGFERVNRRGLAEEYGLEDHVVYTRLMEVAKAHPELVLRRGLGKPVDIKPEGMNLLRDDLELRRGMVRIPYTELTSGTDLVAEHIKNQLRAIMRENPQHFLRHGREALATSEGIRLLEELKASITAPEGYERVEMQEWAAKYGVAPSNVEARIGELKEIYPDDFYRRSQRGVFYASGKVRALLAAAIEESKPPEGYSQLDTTGLRKQFEVGSNVFNHLIEKLANSHPSEIIRQGKNKPIIVTEKGYSLLIDVLEQRH